MRSQFPPRPPGRPARKTSPLRPPYRSSRLPGPLPHRRVQVSLQFRLLRTSVAVQDRRDGQLLVNPPGPNPPSAPANLVPVVLVANAGDQTLVNELRDDIKELNDRLKSAGGRNDQDRCQTIYNVLKGEYSMLVGVRNADPGQLQAQQSAELRALIRQEVGRAGEAAQATPSAPAAASGALPPPAPGTDMSLTPGGTGLRPSPPVPPTNPGEGQPLPQPVPGGSGEWPNVAATNPGTAR